MIDQALTRWCSHCRQVVRAQALHDDAGTVIGHERICRACLGDLVSAVAEHADSVQHLGKTAKAIEADEASADRRIARLVEHLEARVARIEKAMSSWDEQSE